MNNLGVVYHHIKTTDEIIQYPVQMLDYDHILIMEHISNYEKQLNIFYDYDTSETMFISFQDYINNLTSSMKKEINLNQSQCDIDKQIQQIKEFFPLYFTNP